MAANNLDKSLSAIGKSLGKIEKSEASIGKTLDNQLKLDKKLSDLIADQNKLNKSILKQLESMQKQMEAMQRSAALESEQQHKRFVVDTIISVCALLAALTAAGAALYPLIS